MTNSGNGRVWVLAAVPVLQPLLVATALAEPVTVDRALLEKLQQVIEQQQRQLGDQSRQLQSQQKLLDALQRQVRSLGAGAVRTRPQPARGPDVATEAVTTAESSKPAPAKPGSVHSGQPRVKLTVSGQIDRALNLADDGEKTKLYQVDNDASNTRIRLVGKARATDDLTLGTRWEYAVTSNESSVVSQDNESAGDFTDLRWAEISLTSQRWGKVSLGKGSTASDNTAEVDLSGTDLILYSGYSNIMGGLKFRDSNGDLTGIRVNDAFHNMDGLSRKNRLLYETPAFGGFRFATSVIADQRYDAALTWGGKGYGFKAAGALAVADPNRDDGDYQFDGSLSILHQSTGLNLTLAAGLQQQDDQGDQSNLYGKVGWLHRFFDAGETAFGVDYSLINNVPTGSHDGYSAGAAVVQAFERYGTELYGQIRIYSLSNDGSPGAQSITAGTIGTRVKF